MHSLELTGFELAKGWGSLAAIEMHASGQDEGSGKDLGTGNDASFPDRNAPKMRRGSAIRNRSSFMDGSLPFLAVSPERRAGMGNDKDVSQIITNYETTMSFAKKRVSQRKPRLSMHA